MASVAPQGARSSAHRASHIDLLGRDELRRSRALSRRGMSRWRLLPDRGQGQSAARRAGLRQVRPSGMASRLCAAGRELRAVETTPAGVHRRDRSGADRGPADRRIAPAPRPVRSPQWLGVAFRDRRAIRSRSTSPSRSRPSSTHLVYSAGEQAHPEAEPVMAAFLIGGGWPARLDARQRPMPQVDPASVRANLQVAVRLVPRAARRPAAAHLAGDRQWHRRLAARSSARCRAPRLSTSCMFPWLGFTAGPARGTARRRCSHGRKPQAALRRS